MQVIRDVTPMVLSRALKLCNFLDWKDIKVFHVQSYTSINNSIAIYSARVSIDASAMKCWSSIVINRAHHTRLHHSQNSSGEHIHIRLKQLAIVCPHFVSTCQH